MFQRAVARRAAQRERERICLALEIAADRTQAECTVEPSCDVLRDAAAIIRGGGITVPVEAPETGTVMPTTVAPGLT